MSKSNHISLFILRVLYLESSFFLENFWYDYCTLRITTLIKKRMIRCYPNKII